MPTSPDKNFIINRVYHKYINITIFFYALRGDFLSERSKLIRGTAILFTANACAKILGALYKIPLTYIIKEEGMAIYQTAFTVYMMFLTFVTSGFPFATTKLLAEYNASGRYDKIRPVVKSASLILLLIGSAASLIMFSFADIFATSMHEVNAGGAIRVISLSVLFVSVGGIIKSSNEASSDLLPTAISQVFEAAVKLCLGLFLASHFITHSINKAAEGAAMAVSVGELIATLFLFTVWRIKVRRLPKGYADKSDLKAIFSIAVPLLLTGLSASLLSMAEVSAVRRALLAIRFNAVSAEKFLINYSQYSDAFDGLMNTLTFSPEAARKIFGAYTGYAQAIFNLPAGIIATVTVAATPMLVRAITTKKDYAVRDASERVLSLISFISVPCAVIMFLYPDRLLYLLFRNHFSAEMLRSLAPSLIFLCANNMYISLLHLSGRIFEPFVAILISIVSRIILASVLIRIPSINILGAGIGAVISSVILNIILRHMFRSHYKSLPSLTKTTFIPIISSAIMVGFMHPSDKFFYRYFSSSLSFIISAIIGVGVYALTSFLLFQYNKKVQS